MSDVKPVKQIIRDSGVKQWQIAKAIGVSESTMVKILREEPGTEMRQKILQAIEQLKQ